MDLQQLIASFLGGQSNVAGGQGTANQNVSQPQQPVGQPQNAPQQQAPQGGGIMGALSSPLAQSLLAGYFAGIGTPKLQGWGGAISHGGLAALNQYGNAQELQQRQQQSDSLSQYRDAQTQLEQQRMELEKQKMPSELAASQSKAGLVDAETKITQQKLTAGNTPTLYYRLNDDNEPDNTAIEVPPGQAPPNDGHRWVTREEMAKMAGDSVKSKAAGEAKKQAADDKQAALLSKPIGEVKGKYYLNPKTLEQLNSSIPVSEAYSKHNAVVLGEKDHQNVEKLKNALNALDLMDANVGDVLYRQDSQTQGGKLTNDWGVAGYRNFNQNKTAAYDSAKATMTGLPAELLNTGRMNLTEFKTIAKDLPTDGDTVESAKIKTATIRAAIQKKLDNLTPETNDPEDRPGAVSMPAASQAQAQGQASAPAPSNPNFQYTTPGGTPFKRIQ